MFGWNLIAWPLMHRRLLGWCSQFLDLQGLLLKPASLCRCAGSWSLRVQKSQWEAQWELRVCLCWLAALMCWEFGCTSISVLLLLWFVVFSENPECPKPSSLKGRNTGYVYLHLLPLSYFLLRDMFCPIFYWYVTCNGPAKSHFLSIHRKAESGIVWM